MKNLLLFCFCLLVGTMAFGQRTISGQIIDQETGDPLIGATVVLQGTTNGTITDADGNFQISDDGSEMAKLVIGFLGYKEMELSVPADGNLGRISLKADGVVIDEIVVLGVVDIARDRYTPVAVSTIQATEIQERSGNTEFPDIMKNTPSIYVQNQAGGFGDASVFTRGFDQSNTAFLLNGQPINSMEDGLIFWSNWSGMNDIANSVQIQRGLGSSKLAISSVGGTVNIITKATDLEKGGWAKLTYGNDSYIKGTLAYNTGLSGKWGLSALLTHWQGDGWSEGTKGQGQNYFVSVGFRPNPKHNFNFLVTGAPQYHDQQFTKRITQWADPTDKSKMRIKYNTNYGTLNGEYLSERRNYYHKPVANLNWSWKLNDKSSLSTVLYGSWGRGGGTGSIGTRVVTKAGYVDFDSIQRANLAVPDGKSKYALRASVNNHSWYGLVTNFEHQLTENLGFSVGGDIRTYEGLHFRQITNLVGAKYFLDNRNINNPNNKITSTFKPDPWQSLSNFAGEKERWDYDYSEQITYGGLFGQLEWAKNALSAYVQGSVSTQSHVRWDRFQYTPENEKSESINNPGYNIKGGGNYNINDNHNVFVNAGYYSRQPYHDNLYLNFRNIVNEVAENENVIGLEAGYGFRNKMLAINLNVYRTLWDNRVETQNINDGDSITLSTGVKRGFPNGGFVNQSNINQLHQGVELEAKVKATSWLTVKAFASVGDYQFSDNATQTVYDDDRTVVETVDALFIDGKKVGGSAQTIFGVGADISILKNLRMDAQYNYYDNLYANVGPTDNTFKVKNDFQTIKLPSYGILDAGLTYTINLANKDIIKLRGNVYNALNSEYISYATSNIQPSAVEADNYEGVNRSNFVQFGQGLTWNVSLRYAF